MNAPSVTESYDSRAKSYDDKTSFHRRLAKEYINYAKPQPGESLLDLACGTGLVTFEFAGILQSDPNTENGSGGKEASKSTVIGVDISRGMLDIARAKLQREENQRLEISFVECDITNLESIAELNGMEGMFDIITICSALVLVPYPARALKYWSRYLRKGGRLVVDVPSTTSMLALKVFGDMAPEFRIEMLGDRRWIEGPSSLRKIMEDAGMQAEVVETGIWDDIPARTKNGEMGGGVWGVDEGGWIFDDAVKAVNGFARLEGVEREKAREAFVREWERLRSSDGLVREEGRLYVGIGRKQS